MSQSSAAREEKTLEDPDLLGILSVLLAAACWATSGLFVKLILANQGVSALALAFWRDLSSFSCC